MAACVAQIMARRPLGLSHRVDGAAARPRHSACLARVSPTSRASNPRVRSRAARCASFECPGSKDELAERRMALAEFAKQQQQQQQQNSFALSLLLPPSRSSPCLCCPVCAGRSRESSRAVPSRARVERRGESRVELCRVKRGSSVEARVERRDEARVDRASRRRSRPDGSVLNALTRRFREDRPRPHKLLKL